MPTNMAETRDTATAKDVAELAGVSEATVSRCYKSSDSVSKETYSRVMQISEKLNFIPRTYKHRSMPEGKSDVIGVLITQINNHFFASAIEAIEAVAEQNGLTVIICNTNESVDREIKYLEMVRNRVGGLIITPISQTNIYNGNYIKELNDKVMPVIMLDRDINTAQLDGVFVDSARGVFEGIQALIANGHREIGIITGPITSKPGIERLNGYLEALKANGIPINEEYIFYGDFTEKTGYALTQKLLTKQKTITAVFSSNLIMTYGSLKAISDFGYDIPDDIAFLTFDDYVFFGMRNFNISGIYNPGRQLGDEAAHALIKRMRDPRHRENMARRITLVPSLILRGSERFPKNRL